MKYAFAAIAVLSAFFTIAATEAESLRIIGFGIVSAGFAIATALIGKK